MNLIQYSFIAVIAVLVTFCGVQTIRLANSAKHVAALQFEIAQATAKAERVARETNTSMVDALFTTSVAYQRTTNDDEIQKSNARDLAALRAGTLKLRHEWAACETSRLADGSATASELAEANRRREELALAALRIGTAADAKERALIAAYEAVRSNINGAKP